MCQVFMYSSLQQYLFRYGKGGIHQHWRKTAVITNTIIPTTKGYQMCMAFENWIYLKMLHRCRLFRICPLFQDEDVIRDQEFKHM